MKKQSFHFEISDLVVQFLAAFDQVVINRYDVNRTPGQKIQVRYVYAPKQRVLFDLTNPGQNVTLPVVAITMGSITRDGDRVFNKNVGFYAPTSLQDKSNTRSYTDYYRTPVPVNITINMAILTRYQTDMEQILSNFVPYNNPYIIVSWTMPKQYNLAFEQEIRTEILWNGQTNISYPVDVNGGQKAQIVAETSFTIKGWIFPSAEQPVGNIFKITANLAAVPTGEALELGNYFTLSGQMVTPELSGGDFINTDTIVISGAPQISKVGLEVEYPTA
jgi:hypothetical protein